jgi:hypothetical protein
MGKLEYLDCHFGPFHFKELFDGEEMILGFFRRALWLIRAFLLSSSIIVILQKFYIEQLFHILFISIKILATI